MPSLDYPCLDGERRIFIPGKRGFMSSTWPPVGSVYYWREGFGARRLYIRWALTFDNSQTFVEEEGRTSYFSDDPLHRTPLFIDASFDPGP